MTGRRRIEVRRPPPPPAPTLHAALDAERARYFASLGGFTAHVGARTAIEDLRGGDARWFAQHGAAVALARPDFAVFGTAPALNGVTARARRGAARAPIIAAFRPGGGR